MLAAAVAIAAGLAMLGVVAYSYVADDPGSSTVASGDSVDDPSTIGHLDPLAPGGGKIGKLRTKDAAPRSDVFDSEYGRKGRHTVTVEVTGVGRYRATWRDGHVESGNTRGTYTKTRTVNGGLPLAAVTIQAASRLTCTITIDGEKKSSETVAKSYGITWCIG